MFARPIYFTFDFVSVPGANYYLPTTHGNIDVNPGEVKLFTYVNVLINDKWPFRFLLMINSLSMSSDLDLNPEKEDYYSKISWNSGATLLAYRPIHKRNEQLTIGVQSNLTPYIITDSLNTELFSVYYDEQDSIFKGTTSEVQLFLHYIKSGYDFGTMYNAKENIVQLLELAKNTRLKKNWGRLITKFRYLNLFNNYQIGFQLEDYSKLQNIFMDLSFMWNVVRDNQWNLFSSVSWESSVILNRKSPNEELENQGYTSIDFGLSYSREVFDKLMIGTSAGIFHKIKHPTKSLFYDMGLGVSYNFHNSIVRLPLKDELIWQFVFSVYFNKI